MYVLRRKHSPYYRNANVDGIEEVIADDIVELPAEQAQSQQNHNGPE